MNNEFQTGKYGPTALVTGASSGIGKAFSELLAAKGINLLLVARRIERLDLLASELTAKHGVEVTTVEADLAAVTGVQQVIDVSAKFDIGLAISNAGFGVRGHHEDLDPGELQEMLMVNCQAPMLLAHGLIPRLKARGQGGLVFTGSVEGFIGCPLSTAYSATKAFVKNLGEGLWAELSPQGIDVLTLCPGATDTEALARSGIDKSTMPHVMSAEEVARLTLQNIGNGPLFVSSEHYKGMFEQLLAMPRDQALAAMAKGMQS